MFPYMVEASEKWAGEKNSQFSKTPSKPIHDFVDAGKKFAN